MMMSIFPLCKVIFCPERLISPNTDSDNDSHAHENHHHKEKKGKKHEHENVNIRAALIHVIGDILQSVGVIAASVIVYFFPQYMIADPICTFFFSVLVVFTTVPVIRDCLRVLMEGTPIDIDIDTLMNDLMNVKYMIR